MKKILQSLKRLTKYFVGGILFSAPRLFWMGINRTFLPRPLLYNFFLQKALVAAANQHEETLLLIDNQEEENLSPLCFTQKSSLLRAQPHQAKHYLKQALLELGFKQATALPPLSLIFPKRSFMTATLLKTLKKKWEKELGIHCPLVCFPPKKEEQSLQLAFAEWDASLKDPLFLLDAFKKATDKLKPTNARWEHPG